MGFVVLAPQEKRHVAAECRHLCVFILHNITASEEKNRHTGEGSRQHCKKSIQWTAMVGIWPGDCVPAVTLVLRLR